jgi:hypothetical protein
MKYSPRAPGGWAESASLKLPFSDEVAGRSILLRNALELPGAAAKSKKKF